MALSPLTISLSSGVIGRPFLAAVSGQTPGSIVEIANGSALGFGYSNGKLSHPSLSYDTSLAIVRERLPLTGESLLTNFVITAKSDYAIQQQALGINPTPKGYRAAGVTQGDGSLLWTLFVEDAAGSTTTAAIGAVTVTLGALTLSGTLRIGTATSGTIIGATAGSTITGNIPGITVNSAARTYSGTPTGASGTISNALVESLTGATNDNNPSSINVLAVLVTISGTPGAATIGSAYSFTPTTANGSGTKTFSYSGTALAGYGLSFNTATGAITGTVSGSAGTITGTISVTDSSGGPVNLAISITVAAASLVPVNSVAPVLSGNGTTASPYTVTNGTWTNGPITGYAIQYLRDGSPISGATGSTYIAVLADSGANITAQVIATNASGASSPAVSNAIAAGTITAATFTRPTDQPTGILADQIYQCDTETGSVFGVGKATVAYPVTVTANGWIWVRLRDKTTGLQVGPIAAYSVTTATTSVSFDVPGRLGWGYVDMSTDGASWATFAGTLSIGAGDLTLGSGQSLMAGFYQTADVALNTALATVGISVANPNTRVFSTSDGYSPNSIAGVVWSLPADGTPASGARSGAGAAAYLHWMAVARGRNQGFCAHGYNGTYQAPWQWTPTGSNNLQYTQLARIAAAVGGKWRYQFWWQGHADSDSSVYNYAADMDYREFGASGTGGYVALNSYPRANVIRLVNTIPNIFLGPYYYGPMRNAQKIRVEAKNWCAAKNDGTNINGIHVEMPALSLPGDPHPGQIGNIEAAKCLVRAALSDNLGPKLTSATRDVSNPNDLILTFQQTGTDFQLTGSWWKRVAVYLSGSTLNFVGCSTGSRISTTQLRVTMTLPVGGANWGDADAFDIIMGAPWDGDLSTDPSGYMIRDDRTDTIDASKGRPFQTGTTPITAAALNGAGTHTPTANYPATAALGKTGYIAPSSLNDLVMTSASYDTVEHKTGFGFPLIGGRATTRSNQVALNGHGQVNSTVPMTMVGRIKAPAAGANNRTIMTWGNMSLSFSTAGKIFGSSNLGGSAIMAASTVPGSVYWFALVSSLSGTRLYTCIEGGSVVLASALAAAYKYSMTNGFGLVSASGTADFFTIAGGSIFDVGMYNTDTIYTGASGSFSPPSTPLTGAEANLIFACPMTKQNDPSLTGVQADLVRAL